MSLVWEKPFQHLIWLLLSIQPSIYTKFKNRLTSSAITVHETVRQTSEHTEMNHTLGQEICKTTVLSVWVQKGKKKTPEEITPFWRMKGQDGMEGKWKGVQQNPISAA